MFATTPTDMLFTQWRAEVAVLCASGTANRKPTVFVLSGQSNAYVVSGMDGEGEPKEKESCTDRGKIRACN